MNDAFNRPVKRDQLPIVQGVYRGFQSEALVTAGLALAVLLLAKIVVFGDGFDFRPIFTTPVVYSGDAVFFAHMASVLRDGWINVSLRDGYPFGSELYDFPTSDSGNFLIIKLLMQIFESPFAVSNIFFLSTYPVVFVVSFQVMKWLGLQRHWAYAAAAIFTFLPFHQMRFAHLLYTMYFAVPLFFYFAYSAASGDAFGPGKSKDKLRWFGECAVLAMLASFGVYNAAFAVILITFAGLFNAVEQRRYLAVLNVIPWIVAIALGVLLNLLPNIVNWAFVGKSAEVAHRLPSEAEFYGIKIIQMLVPIPNHFLSFLADIGRWYVATAPLVNENRTAVLGLAGSVGVLLAGVVLIRKLTTTGYDRRMTIVAYILIVALFFGVIGGGGAIFAYAVSPMLRGWNRISPFIAFAAITLLFLHLQWLDSRLSMTRRVVWIAPLAAAFIALVGIADQTGRRCDECLSTNRVTYAGDRAFIELIEGIIPPGSAIYQLPYSAFPEVPVRNRMLPYEHFLLTANSAHLKSNYGVMKSYPGDLFYRELEGLPLTVQIEVLRRLGFAGLWINKKGYADNGVEIIGEASRLLGRMPDAESSNGDVVFFVLPNAKHVDVTGMRDVDIIELAGVKELSTGSSSQVMIGSQFAFNEPALPRFIKSVSGLSVAEQWGRWSDANISPSAGIEFASALPENVKLRLELKPFGPNANQPITIRFGDHTEKFILKPGNNVVVLEIARSGTPVTEIELNPFSPVAPESLGLSEDKRKLGVGLVKIEAFE